MEAWYEKIDSSKEAWENTHEKIQIIREKIIELKSTEGNNIKKKSAAFKSKIADFRKEFKQNLPFHLKQIDDDSVKQAYDAIDD